MRRTDREVTDSARIRDILSRGEVLRLAMHAGDYPYVVSMNYGFTLTDGVLTLYLHCAGEGRKIDCLRADPHVAFELDCDRQTVSGQTACAWGYAYASVMGTGDVTFLTDPAEKAAALAVLMRTQTGSDFAITEEMAASVTVLRVAVREYTAKCRPVPQV